MKRKTCFLILIFIAILWTGCQKPRDLTPTLTPTLHPVEIQLLKTSPERIEFQFSQPVKPVGTKPSLEISPSLSGVEIWEAHYTILAFEPATGFEAIEYAIAISAELLAANHLSPEKPTLWKLQFTPAQSQTENSNPAAKPPRVFSRTPGTAKIAQRRPEFELTFDQEMNAESVRAALQVVPDFPFETRWEDQKLFIQPLAALDLGVTYQFTLAKSAQSLAGVPLRADYTWSYTTSPALARISYPTASDHHQPIAIHFNYQMDTAQVSEAFELDPPLPGDLSWDQNQTTLSFTPASPLPPEIDFTIDFQGDLLDAQGHAIPKPEQIHFRTPSVVAGMSPKSDQGVDPGAAIWVAFDRAMDPATTEAAFSITPTLTGTLSWEANTLYFTPREGYLEAQRDYVLQMAASARDATGQSVFKEAFQRWFTTGEFQKIASFGEEGANVQVLDADGRRAVQFVLSTKQKTRLTFELYHLPLDEFVRDYAAAIRNQSYWAEETELNSTPLDLARTWQVEYSESGFGYGNTQEVRIPEDVRPGIYLLNMGNQIVHDQLILVLTHNTLLVKQAGNEVLSWVTDINGQSLEGLEVSLFSPDGLLLTQGRTDENGLYRTHLPDDSQAGWVIARQWDDYTLSGLNTVWQEARWYWWSGPTEVQSFSQNHAAYVYTDRPIYKPGQTVYFKAIIRKDQDAELSLPASGTAVIVRIRDARENIVQTFDLKTNYYGTVNGAFPLAEGAMLGNYAVEVSLDGKSFRQVFKVQDYRKPDFEVQLETNAERYLLGETITVTVDTQYFFGEPVANASLTIQRYSLGSPYYWYESSDSASEYIWYESNLEAIHGRTDQNGRYTFTLPASLKNNDDEFYRDYYNWGSNLRQARWGLEVSVNDGSNQEVSGFTVYQVFNAQEKLRLDPQGYWKAPSQPFSVDLTVCDLFDQPVADRQLSLKVLRWDAKQSEYLDFSAAVEAGSDDQGQAIFTLMLEDPGYYRLQAFGQDAGGHPLEYLTGVYVYQPGSSWEGRSRGEILEITANQQTYRPGETAQLLIESTFSGPALLTFERGRTRHAQEVLLEAPLTLVEVPIHPDYAPNIYMTVNAWVAQDTTLDENTNSNRPDSRLHTASLEVQVPVSDKTLAVQITPDRQTYAPRATASFRIQVTDPNGDPVRAELSLALIDEAVFSLSEDLSGSIFEAFYGRRARDVTTFYSMAPYRELWGGGERGGGGGDDGGPLANPRSAFPDTAIWLPEVRTNAAGEAWVTVPLPDTLTTWRLTAKAISAQHAVGESVTQIITRQPIIVQPQLPRLLTVGDQVVLSALIHNYSQESRSLTVTLLAEGLELQAPITQTLTLPPGEVRLLGWQVRAQAAGEARVTVRAVLPDGGGDAVQITIPVQPLAIPEVSTWVGDFREALDLAIPWPAHAHEHSTVKIELNRSIAGSLTTGLEYLTGFPYGCVEQTMSKALPNAVVGRAFHRLNIGNPQGQTNLTPKINAGLQRLYGYQHDDGGWGWWYDDDTDAYQTAWVVFGLATTVEAGYEVDPAVIERGANWLSGHLAEMPAETRAYALYSLAVAGQGVLTDTLRLAGEAAELDAFSQFALALALHELGERPSAQQMVDRLVASAVIQNGEASWPGSDQDGEYQRKTMASDTRTTALGLRALVQIRPGHPLEGSLVRWLMNRRTPTGWGTTNETSYAILGLTDHLLADQQTQAQSEYRIELNGVEIARGNLNRTDPAISLEIPALHFRAGENQLRITQTGNGSLYYLVSNRTYFEQAAIEAAGNLSLSRAYLDPQTHQPLAEIQAGDLVQVQLTVSLPRAASYVIVEDRLPGGLEALNSELNTSSHASCADPYAYYNPCEPRFNWKSYGYNYKEVRFDRVSFFITEMAPGQSTFTYLARATRAGSFTALPAEAWAMYDPTLWGRSASAQSLIRDLE